MTDLLGWLAVTLTVSCLILIIWLMMRPVSRIQVLFTQADGEHVCLSVRPEHWPNGHLVIMAQVPAELTGVSMVGCVITIMQLNRVIDIRFTEPVVLEGAIGVFLGPDGVGRLSITNGPTVSF